MKPTVPIFGKTIQLGTAKISVLLLLFCFLLYGNSISNGYALDDELVTNTDRQIHPLVDQGLSGIPSIFTQSYSVNKEQNYEYRPLVLTSFAIEKTFFGTSENWVHLSHFIQILLYFFLGLLLYKTLRLLFDAENPILILATVILFLSLPIHTEVVNSLKNRDEILSMYFSILALNFSLKYHKANKLKFLLFCTLAITAALLSKKTALPFIAIIPMALFFCRKLAWKPILLTFISLGLGRLLFVLFRKGLVQSDKIRDFATLENPLFGQNLIHRIPTFVDTLFWYFRSTLLHFNFHSYYGLGGYEIATFSSTSFLFALIFLMGLLFVVVLGFIHQKFRLISFGLLFFLLSIAGACNLLFPMVGIVAERLVFTGSLGVLVALVFTMDRLQHRFNKPNLSKVMLLGLGLYVCVNGFIVVQRNTAWNDRITLYQTDAKDFPSAKSQALLGQELQFLANEAWQNLDTETAAMYLKVHGARQAYETAIKIYPNYPKIQNNLATLYSVYYCDEGAAIKLTNQILLRHKDYKEARLNHLNACLKAYVVWCKMSPFVVSEKQDYNPSKKINAYHADFGLMNQFEERGKLILKNGLNPNSIQTLVSYARGMETMNTNLADLSPPFATNIDAALHSLYEGKTPNHNILDTFRKEIVKKDALTIGATAFLSMQRKLQNDCFQSAEEYEKAFPKERYADLMDRYFMEANDFQSIIRLHKALITKGKGGAKDYIQIGNAYVNLGDQTKAVKALKKGYDFIAQSKLQNKTSELQRLQRFIEKIESSN